MLYIQLITTSPKSDFNFLHDGTVDYAIVFAADFSSTLSSSSLFLILSNAISSLDTGFFMGSDQSTGIKSFRFDILRGVGGSFAYSTFLSNQLTQVVDGMAIYSINAPLSSLGDVTINYNKILTQTLPNLNSPLSTANSKYDLSIGRLQGTTINGAFGDLADLVFIKNPTSAEIEAVEDILIAKNNITI